MQAGQSRIQYHKATPRIITPENIKRFLKVLSRDEFEGFNRWIPELTKLESDYYELEGLVDSPSTCDEEMEEREDDIHNIKKELRQISSEMKKSNSKLYQRLTRLIFDDAPKSKISQNVKVRRDLVNQLRALPEQENLTTERLVELALIAYLNGIEKTETIDNFK